MFVTCLWRLPLPFDHLFRSSSRCKNILETNKMVMNEQRQKLLPDDLNESINLNTFIFCWNKNERKPNWNAATTRAIDFISIRTSLAWLFSMKSMLLLMTFDSVLLRLLFVIIDVCIRIGDTIIISEQHKETIAISLLFLLEQCEYEFSIASTESNKLIYSLSFSTKEHPIRTIGLVVAMKCFCCCICVFDSSTLQQAQRQMAFN